ncbi:oxidoreductase [Rhodopirellula sp. SM50]|nr:oxidoreductase [Rhodopirellula sp. SM50]
MRLALEADLMAWTILTISALPAVLLLALATVVPRRDADAAPLAIRTWVTALATVQLAVASVLTIGMALRLAFGSSDPDAWHAGFPGGGSDPLPIYLDGVSTLMFLMVSFIGWVICRYSVRYLDGDRSQGNYFLWTGFTLAAVALMVLSGHLLLFYIAWLMTSIGLHHLLLHDSTRAAAVRAAWTKFAVIRIADVALAIACILLYREFGTAYLSELFTAVADLSSASVPLQTAALLLVLAGAIKSAQFPFHTWLPQTLETPTPVSALMHAGIVNAGGYLLVRTSPIVSAAPWTLAVLATIGAVTACYAAVVMLTQTSVKKSLAYSTIAQMGFMMLQCGLGAFSAALLHILAHSMYKAHAFLGSGDAIAQRSRMGAVAGARSDRKADGGEAPRWVTTGLAAAGVSLGCLALASLTLGINPSTKPGGLVLGAVLCLAIAHWLEKVYASADRRLVLQSSAFALALCFLYAFSYRIVDGFVADSVPVVTLPVMQWAVIGSIIGCGFISMLWTERATTRRGPESRGGRWYVHASNGFYVESVLRRVFGSLSKS